MCKYICGVHMGVIPVVYERTRRIVTVFCFASKYLFKMRGRTLTSIFAQFFLVFVVVAAVVTMKNYSPFW